MALGGGNWTSQNKDLPGTYINFSSAQKADSALSERGIVAVPLTLSWGPTDEIFALSAESIVSDCKKTLGYSYSDPEMFAIRELFKNAKTVLTYRNTSDAVKAENDYATAKYSGIRGNDIKIVITKNVDDETMFDVLTYLDSYCVDTQRVGSAGMLQNNDYVDFKKEAELIVTAGVALAGGTNGTGATGASYQAFLTALERKSFNILACPAEEADTINLFIAYTNRMTTEVGANFQLVCYKPSADSEYVIGVENKAENAPVYGLVYWVAGAEAACGVNQSLTNKVYDGELELDLNYSQAALSDAIKTGKFILHDVNGVPRVLDDINTLVTLTETKNEDLKQNQVIRLCHDAANNIALLFNTWYLGIIPNDENGRISLWNDICKLFQNYEKNRAIEDFTTESIVVSRGENKRAVSCQINALSVVNAMSALYMNIIIA